MALQVEDTVVRGALVANAVHPRIVLGHTDGGFRLLSSNDERLETMKRYGAENVVVVRFTPEVARLSACEFYETCLKPKLNVKTLLVGYDNMFGNKQRNDFDRLLALPDVECVRTEALIEGNVEISSTQIRNRLADGDIVTANAMLGYGYSVEGEVVHGQAIGRTIDFPTANIEIGDSMKAMPKEGVYAVRVFVKDSPLMGIANWGARPTVGGSGRRLEVNILDYNDELYGQKVRVEFEYRLRDIVEFNSLEELSCQLRTDKECASKLLNT